MKILPNKYLKKLLVLFSEFVLFPCFCLFLSSFSFADTVTYQYDSLNRLTGVQYSNGTIIEYSYDAAGNILTRKVFLRTACEACSGSPVVLTNVTFNSGTICKCSDSTSITIGTNVIIKSGANVTFEAPTVKIQSGFHAEEGSVVNIKQQ
ncbi:MAG: RHS repeat domain-containing protein [Pseudomonadota bacterium]